MISDRQREDELLASLRGRARMLVREEEFLKPLTHEAGGPAAPAIAYRQDRPVTARGAVERVLPFDAGAHAAASTRSTLSASPTTWSA